MRCARRLFLAAKGVSSIERHSSIAILIAGFQGQMRDHVQLTYRDNISYDEARAAVIIDSRTKYTYLENTSLDITACGSEKRGKAPVRAKVSKYAKPTFGWKGQRQGYDM